MRNKIVLASTWFIKGITPIEKLDETQLSCIEAEECSKANKWYEAAMPAQVHEILLKEGEIADPYITGKARECLWVAEQDWIYRNTFSLRKLHQRVYLNCKGLDTLADVYVNGKHVAYHNDMFLPLRVDITEFIKDNNTLTIHFHSPHEYLKTHKLPEEWEGKIASYLQLRKSACGFKPYLGGKPYLTPIGIYDTVELDLVTDIEVTEVDVRTWVSERCSTAKVGVVVACAGNLSGSAMNAKLSSPSGKVIAEERVAVKSDASKVSFEFAVKSPVLWWPRGYGDQPLYKIEIVVSKSGVVSDALTRTIGFKRVEMDSPFDFKINNVHIRLWGGNFTPLEGYTCCFNREKALQILDRAENANMNTLRIWGSAFPYGDELYDEADRRGFLLWQEFFMDYGIYPGNPEYRALCKKEAEHLVKRLKHHAGLLMWCGGNENFMGRDYSHPEVEYIGEEIFTADYRSVCEELDPGRFYLPSSPYGGAFANDPLVLDTHSYTNTWFVPGADYPVMMSESLRVSPPPIRSLKRFLSEKELWPKGYSGMQRYGEEYPWPPAWTERSSHDGWKKMGAIEKFHDADSLEEFVYRFAAAHALYQRETVERCRRGKPTYDAIGRRRCFGYIVWKLNSTWAHIYSGMLDNYNEPHIPYYALKRAYEPVLLSFDIQDHIYLWLVNDSPRDTRGTVSVGLFDTDRNQFLIERTKDVDVKAGESNLITDLDRFGQFHRKHMLFACLKDRDGNVIARSNDYVDVERHLRFPEASLQVGIGGNELTITTDRFARCVELNGDDNGDEFGWLFEDNYFDLFPGEIKKVRVLGSHKSGVITAKPHFSPHAARVGFESTSC